MVCVGVSRAHDKTPASPHDHPFDDSSLRVCEYLRSAATTLGLGFTETREQQIHDGFDPHCFHAARVPSSACSFSTCSCAELSPDLVPSIKNYAVY